MRIICFLMIATGGVLMSIAAVQYNQLARNATDKTQKRSLYRRLVGMAARVLPFLFVVGYLVGAVDVMLHEVAPIYYFIGIMFFFGAIYVFVMVQSQREITFALRDKNEELQQVLARIAENNRQLRAQVDAQVAEVEMQSKLLRTVNDTASILLASDVDAFEGALWKCMGMLAESVDVDRVYIWKNHEKDGKLYCTQVYEWSEGAEPQQDTAITIDIPYDENIPGWEEKLSHGHSVNGLVKNLSQAEQEQLVPQGIISILVVPVFLQDWFWGFVGFDDCHKERSFGPGEEGILRSGSLLIANAMLRNEMTQNLMQAREEALASTKAKGDFLANMSHEIRTPINAITGMAAIARGADDMEKVHDCLDKVDAASRQLLGLINDILDMSKIEAGKLELVCEPFELVAAIQNVKSIIGVRAAEKRQQLVLEIAPNVPHVVLGDDMRLSQVLLNLLSNAVKFTPEGGHVGLSVRLLATRGGRHWLEARVRDDGIGISAEEQGRLFRSFEQADRGTARRFGGSGLGLVISRRIAQLMEGDITVESTPGQGSCFTVQFYLQAGTPDMLKQAPEKMEYDFGGRTALLVEDIEVNREIVLALLADFGIEVECAENGQEAVDQFLADPGRYDIIFMDVHMPVMDGYAATERIRASGLPQAQKVPILAMTANAFSEDVTRCRKAGMDDHVAKPIDLDVLLEKMAALMAGGNGRETGKEQPE